MGRTKQVGGGDNGRGNGGDYGSVTDMMRHIEMN